VYALPELSLPTMVELFTQRAQAARPGVEVPVDTVADLCGHLDGLPLAVELAAARVRVMSVAEIAAHLADRFALLRGGPRDAPSRHQTLHAVVDWSWHLLDPAGQAAVRALSVFPGGFTAAAAAHLTGSADVLEDLVDQSLLKVVDTGSGTRFRMLETVREFGATGFLAWARDFGLARCDALLSPDPLPAIDLCRAEQDNLTHAMHQAAARNDGATVAATAAVLSGLWMIESNYARMTALVDEAGRVLSHYRPEPEHVEVTRTAAAWFTAFTFSLVGPRANRSVVVLRRLPPAPPDTLVRALATVLAAVVRMRPVDDPTLAAMCASDQPLLAGVANAFASYVWEYQGELDRAVAAAERTLAAFEDDPTPWSRLLAHARLGDLLLQKGDGARALRYLADSLTVLQELGVRNETMGVRLGMVLVRLQLGGLDEAERELALVEPDLPDDAVDSRTFSLSVRAEILLARGQVEAGLRLWRHAAGLLRDTVARGTLPGYDGWALEVESAAVVAHARHGRLEPVGPLVDALPDRLAALLDSLAGGAPATLMNFPTCGALLLAQGTVDIARGDGRSGARLTALAERFQFNRGFLPTLSPDGARQAAEEADKAAYADWVSTYAALPRADLPAAAMAAMNDRGHA
jgi:tetratricopeptide (TPR) repeat protein